MLKRYIPALLIPFFLPLCAFSQDSGKAEEPFKRDMMFNRSIDELLVHGSDSDTNRIDVKRRVRSVQKAGIDFDGALEAGPYNTNPLFNQFPNLPMIHYNRVNGLFLGLKKERMQWHDTGGFFDIERFRPHGLLGYGFASNRLEYAVGLERFIGRANRVMIGAEIHRATATEDYWRVGLIESSLTAFFSSYDFPDYHEKDGFGTYIAVRGKRWYEAALSYNNDDFSTLEVETRYSLFGKREIFRENQPIDVATDRTNIERFNVALTFNPNRLIMSRLFSFSAKTEIEIADNDGFNNDFNYNKYLAEFQFFSNFEPGSLLKWRVRAGSITGDAPLFKQFQLGGIGSLRGSPYKIFTGNQMLLSNLEAQFGQIARGYSDWIDLNSIYITLFLDSGYVRESSTLRTSSNPFNDMGGFSFSDLQHDVGAGLGTNLIRAELAWPLKRFGSTPTLWVRFNPTF
ncbi:MAG: BamA/TamA family outer membrane protein [Balneolaceae bacterium]